MLAKGDAVAAALSGQEAASFARCLELLRAVGDPPELACARYAEAVGVLGNGSLLSAAARFYLERHPSTLPQITLAEAAGLLPWRHNSLRHSFCTYRAAATKNVPQTALEAGNSAATIFSHYRALATEAEGKAWFAIEPKQRPRASSQ